jgi:hypothetical protein
VDEVVPCDICNEFPLMKKRLELRRKKNADYAKADDIYWNFRLVENATGIPAWVGVYVRLCDKIARIGRFIEKGHYEVEDERVEDTMMDACNYSDIMYELYKESKELPK